MARSWRHRGSYRFVERWFDCVHRHVTLVYPYAAAEEIVTQVFLRALGGGRPAAAPSERAWLFGLARQVVHEVARQDARFRERNGEAVALGLRDAIDDLDNIMVDEARRVVAGLRALPLELRELLRLHTVEELDLEEAGWITGRDAAEAATAVAEAEQLLADAVSDLVTRDGGDGDGAN